MSYTCPNCKITSHHPKDEEFGWCAKCNKFGYEYSEGVCALDSIVGTLQSKVRSPLGLGAPFSLQFEQVSEGDGPKQWRALIKLGSQVWKHGDPQESPTLALTDLLDKAIKAYGGRDVSPP